jgi:hypothetical protein
MSLPAKDFLFFTLHRVPTNPWVYLETPPSPIIPPADPKSFLPKGQTPNIQHYFMRQGIYHDSKYILIVRFI